MTQKIDELVLDEYKPNVPRASLDHAPKPAPPPAQISSAGRTVALPLEVWARTCGTRPDQLEGFRFWARARKLLPRTAKEWEEAFDAFSRRPV